MANPGVGNKFVSVNLNKSYGQHAQHPQGNSYGQSRTRGSGHGGSGGGGMVVLSRPRSSQKAGPKLSVPPPLNLPSLRKEHEKFDTLGTSGSAAGGGVSGSGMRPGSSGMGWTKPVNVGLQEKEISGSVDKGVSIDLDMHITVDASNKGGSAYMPPSARSGPVLPAYVPVEKATVLRGEDFPSLRAAVPAGSGSSQRQKDGPNPKQKQLSGEDTDNERRPSSHMSTVDMRPQGLSSRHIFANGVHENGDQNHTFGSSRMSEQSRKQDDYFSGPLPLVRLNPRSDWADDERDTSRGLIERGRDSRDNVFSKSEAYWDGDFDMPKASFLPHKPAHGSLDRWGQRDNDTGKYSSSEVHRADPHGRDVGISGGEGREGGSWRISSPIPKGGAGVQESRNERNNLSVRSSMLSMETRKDNKHVSSSFRDVALDDLGRKEIAHGQGGRLSWNSNFDSFNNRGTERIARDHNGSEQFTKYPGDGPQKNSASKSSSGGKGLPVNDSILNFTKDKRPFSKNEKPHLEDPFLKDYGDGRDSLSGSLVGAVKRKKDMLKQTDFYDPVRESFEAELERVQKMQEEERQRALEEQERALELARREEEERARLAREQEEMQRRLEEEAKEAAWRAEQERLEALRRAEEQRIARGEEKRRLLLEEERRKQAAKQKLLELEEKIAKRRAETVGGSSHSLIADERYAAPLKEKDTSGVADTGDWEDSENVIERIATPASSDSSIFNRTIDVGSRQNISWDSSISAERGKLSNSWRRDPFETGSSSTFGLAEQEGGHYGPTRDASHGGRTLQRKEFSGAGYLSHRSHNKAGTSEPQMDDFFHTRGHRWNLVDGDSVNRNSELDPEFHENFSERFAGDVGWGHSRSHGYPYPPSSEQFCQNSEADGSYSFGRSRYSMKQPRVLPPPSLSSMHKNGRGGEVERPRPSSFLDSEMDHTGSVRSGSTLNVGHGMGHQEDVDLELLGVKKESTDEQKLDPQIAPRCDSQSSLSVSSPPDSPVHLSHDDLDESGEYSLKSAAGQDGDFLIPEKEAVVYSTEAGQVANAPRSISGEDEGEWTEENNELLQEQEEYDEDEEGYQEEDEVREADDEIGDRCQDFDDIHLENESSAGLVDNLVLGFNEGVEVPVPSDEYEQSPRNREVAYAGPSVSLGHGQEEESAVRQSSDVRTGQHVDGSSESSMDVSSRLLQDAEKAMQRLVIKPNNLAVTSAASQILDNTNAPVRHVVPSSSNLILHSTAPAVAAQAETPKLQFGLFSGPSLIPSPVPAIQIGSIQMPLHLHPQVTPSLSPMQQAHPPIFQFGQLRYSAAFPPGIVSMAPPPVSLVQPNVPANFPFNQSRDGSLSVQPSQDIRAQNFAKMKDASLSAESQPGIIPRHSILPHDKSMKNNPSPAREKAEGMFTVQQDQVENSHFLEGNNVPDFQLEEPDQQNGGGKNYKFMSNSKKWEGQGITGVSSSQAIRKEKDFNGSKAHGSVNGGKVKHYVFKVKNPASRSFLPENEVSQSDSSGYQRRQRRTVRRTEFRVKENGEKRRSAILGSPSLFGPDDRSSINARSTVISGRTCPGKAVLSSKLPKRTFESESIRTGSMNNQEMESRRRSEKRSLKESIPKSQSVHQPLSLEQIHKSNVHEEDIDAPLQSGIVRVFQQPGIEAPSDEDDFIEVRSKRQMLNDKREQREKEIKAKSHVAKVPRKSRSLQNTNFPSSAKRISSLRSGETVTTGHPDFATADGRGLASIEVSVGFSASMGSQPLAPIGTPAAKTEAQADSVPQKIMSVSADIGKNIGSGLIFESKNKVMDNVQPLDSWGNSGINQQVMSLTQSQLDEAMKPAKFDARVSVGETSYTVTEGSVPLTSISAKDKSFSSAASPINSLLAGEKIQFGAVTSSTVLPPNNHALSLGIGPPNSCLPGVQVSHKISADEDSCNIFFDKDKNSGEPCVHLEDSEAEAEAAASAVAVAAISSDEIVGNGLGHSVSVSDAKTYGVVDVARIPAGAAGDQESANHLRAEDPLNVSLPADLSVETPSISLWQPLTSSQSTSSQLLSHFPGGPPSHFPFYEMNPMMGSPIFAFGPNEESASTQQQSQKSSVPNSGPRGSWPQCHSGVDSFYGPPAGFTGPFIGPGGIPGVQGPPHMVVYNHFAPVGQFGQVGLSFMGTTFIPSGRQPDWKHNPASAAMVGEGDMNNINVVPAQRNPANMPAPIQHLAPGSPLLPLASPMFDVPPFQTNPEMSVHARWAHLPASPLQSSSMSLPMQQQAGALPPQFNNNGPSVDQSLAASRFAETRTSTPESSRNFPVATDASANRLRDKLGLLDPSSSSLGASTQSVVAKNSPLNASSIDAGNFNNQNGGDIDGCSSETAGVFENKSSQQRSISSQNYSSSSGYNYPRGGPSQKGNEWPHRRAGFQGRNNSFGAEKSFASSKVKQIYVAKQNIGGKTASS